MSIIFVGTSNLGTNTKWSTQESLNMGTVLGCVRAIKRESGVGPLSQEPPATMATSMLGGIIAGCVHRFPLGLRLPWRSQTLSYSSLGSFTHTPHS